MHEGFLCVRRPVRRREGFWPVGLKEVPDYCHSPAKNLQGLPVASSVKASLLAWHLRPCLFEPSSCSSQHLYSVPPRWVPPWPSTRHVVLSPHLYPYRCPHLKPLSPCLLLLCCANPRPSKRDLLVPLSPEFLQQWFSNLSVHQTHGEDLLQHRSQGPPLGCWISQV